MAMQPVAAVVHPELLTPQSVEAERATLGAMILERGAIAQAVEILRPEDFYHEVHRCVYEAILTLFDRGEPVDLITLAEELRRLGKLDECGGASYIGLLIESCPSTANVTDYARIVEEKAILRNLISAAHQIAGSAYEAAGMSSQAELSGRLMPRPEELETLIDQAEQTIFAVGQRRLRGQFESAAQLLKRVFEGIDDQYRFKGMVRGIPTGFRDFDDLTSGLQPSDFIVIAGRPGMGKTALALSIAQNVAIKQKLVVGIFSLEMSKEHVVQRLLCSIGRVDSHRLRSGNVTEEDWKNISKALRYLCDAPLFIEDSPDLSPFEIRAKARRLQAERGLGLVIVDYLQLVRPPRRIDNRVQEVSDIARSLKTLSRELNVPVIVLSQLSRSVEQRETKRPVLADLRDSGAIEAEADMVAFIYRESYYEEIKRKRRGDREPKESKEPEDTTAEIIIAKQRNGPTGAIKLSFLKPFARFENLDTVHQP